MSGLNKEDELGRAKVLLDIYRNENEQIKHEYRVLWDKYVVLEEKNKELLQEVEKYNNSRSIKILRRIKNSKMCKLLRKIVKK